MLCNYRWKDGTTLSILVKMGLRNGTLRLNYPSKNPELLKIERFFDRNHSRSHLELIRRLLEVPQSQNETLGLPKSSEESKSKLHLQTCAPLLVFSPEWVARLDSVSTPRRSGHLDRSCLFYFAQESKRGSFLQTAWAEIALQSRGGNDADGHYLPERDPGT